MHKPRRNGKTYGELLAEVLGLGSGTDRMIRGFALMTTTIMLGLLLAITAVLLTSAFNTRKVGNTFEQTLASEQIAEAGIHKAMYCLKASSGGSCGGTYGASYVGESNVAVGTGSFTTTVTGDSTTKTVKSVGASATGQTKTVESDITKLPPTTALVLAAALQAGSGGITLGNNSIVSGGGDSSVTDTDVTSVGDISCANGVQIKGNAAVTRSGGTIGPSGNGCIITKNAYADNVLNDTVGMDAYYLTPTTGIAGSTVTGTKYPNSPTPVPTPFPNLNISYWESIAAAGTVHNGAWTIPDGTSLGATKITGDVTMTNSSTTITLSGPIWITGNLTLGSHTTIKLDPAYGSASGIIIVDGIINIPNGADFQGSGTTGSVIVVASNSTDSTGAIVVQNNLTGGVLYAPYGRVSLWNNAQVPAAVGASVELKNNNQVNPNGLNIFNSPINLAASVANVNWHIGTNTWREFK